MTFVAADRVAKYRRVFPCLRLDQAVFLHGQPLTLRAAGLEEHCDLLARLVDGQGRIHAEIQLMAGPETAKIPLGAAMNVRPGFYEVVLSPLLDQYHGQTPVKRRIPVTIASEEPSARHYSDGAGRAAELLDALAEASGPLGALIRINRAKYRRRDDTTLAEAVRAGDGTLAFAASFAADAPHAESAHQAVAEALQALAARGDLVGLIAATLNGGSDDRLPAGLRAAGLDGQGIDVPEAIAALVALSYARPSHADLAEAVLDRIALGHALRSNAGFVAASADGPTCSRVGPLSALSRLLWGVGSFGGADSATVALALSGYQAPALIQAIAMDPEPRETLEPGRDGGTLVTRVVGAAAITVHKDGWQVRVGPDIVLSGHCRSASGTTHTVQAMDASPPLVGFHALDGVECEGDVLLARAGAHVVALSSDLPFELDPSSAGAGLAISGGGRQWGCCVTSAESSVSPREIARTCSKPAFDVGEPQRVNRLISQNVSYDDATSTLTVRVRDEALLLDFGPAER